MKKNRGRFRGGDRNIAVGLLPFSLLQVKNLNLDKKMGGITTFLYSMERPFCPKNVLSETFSGVYLSVSHRFVRTFESWIPWHDNPKKKNQQKFFLSVSHELSTSKLLTVRPIGLLYSLKKRQQPKTFYGGPNYWVLESRRLFFLVYRSETPKLRRSRWLRTLFGLKWIDLRSKKEFQILIHKEKLSIKRFWWRSFLIVENSFSVNRT